MDTTKTKYRQCKLRHPATNREEVAWIPSIYAYQGRWLEIEGEDGWQVKEVYKLGSLRTLGEFDGQRHAQKHFQGSSGLG